MTEVSQTERQFLASAEGRIGKAILVLAPLGTVVAAVSFGLAVAGAFAFGAVLAYLNLRWIVAVVDALVKAQKAEVPYRTYLNLFLPLVLLVAVLYVIFSHSWLSLAGLLSGLSLLVVGVLLEGVYEIVLGARG